MPSAARITSAGVFMLPLLKPKSSAGISAPTSESTSGSVQPPCTSVRPSSARSEAEKEARRKNSGRSACEADIELDIPEIDTRDVSPGSATSGRSANESCRDIVLGPAPSPLSAADELARTHAP